MDENGWGLTALGFRRPTYTQLLDALEYKARELFGATANLTVRSPIGMFLRIYAWILNILFSLIEDVYNSRFVDTAVGTSLFNLGRAIGLQLLSAQKASGYLVITGPAGTIIPEGWLAGTNGGIQFYTVTEAEIRANDTALVPARCTMTGGEGNVAAETVTVIRLEQLEKRVQAHNNLIERTYKLEERTELQEEKIRVANHRIDDLEQFHKPD